MSEPKTNTIVPTATAPVAPVAETERPHHPYSPSSLANLEACPDYIGRDSKAVRSIIGTIAHKATETQEDDTRLDDDDAAAVAECLDFVEERRLILQQEATAAVTDNNGVLTGTPVEIQELKEAYLPIDDIVFDDAISTTAGYVDHVLLNYNITYAEVIDWKFGYWAVEGAETNPQGIAYVLGLFKKYPSLRAVRFWFKQPLIGLLSEHTFNREEIPVLYLRIQAIVARARLARRKQDFSTARAYVPACNFCANLGRCPIGLANALKVGKKFHPLEFPDDITPTMILDPQNTKKALTLASVVKIWAEAFRRQVTDRVLRNDAAVPEGMIIQTMPGRRGIVDLSKFREIALQYVTRDEYEKCLDATFGPIEEIIKDKSPRGTKKSAVEDFKKALVDSGAVVHGDGYAFLKVQNDKGKNNVTQKQNE
jgi:hypothetical protein